MTLAKGTLMLAVAAEAADAHGPWAVYIRDIEMIPLSGGRLPPLGASPGIRMFRGCPELAT